MNPNPGQPPEWIDRSNHLRACAWSPAGGTSCQVLRDERTAAECELSDARFDELEVEGVLAFSEHVLGNMASLWSAANLSDRVRLQMVRT